MSKCQKKHSKIKKSSITRFHLSTNHHISIELRHSKIYECSKWLREEWRRKKKDEKPWWEFCHDEHDKCVITSKPVYHFVFTNTCYSHTNSHISKSLLLSTNTSFLSKTFKYKFSKFSLFFYSVHFRLTDFFFANTKIALQNFYPNYASKTYACCCKKKKKGP